MNAPGEWFVHYIRTDSDIDAGRGPYSSRDDAQSYADLLNNRLDQPVWFDSAEVSTVEPADGCGYPK